MTKKNNLNSSEEEIIQKLIERKKELERQKGEYEKWLSDFEKALATVTTDRKTVIDNSAESYGMVKLEILEIERELEKNNQQIQNHTDKKISSKKAISSEERMKKH